MTVMVPHRRLLMKAGVSFFFDRSRQVLGRSPLIPLSHQGSALCHVTCLPP